MFNRQQEAVQHRSSKPGNRSLPQSTNEIPIRNNVRSGYFNKLLELRSVTTLQEELQAQGVRSKRRTTADGRELGGAVLSRGTVYHLLSNPVYIGKTLHKGILHPGKHETILDLKLWRQVSEMLKHNRITRRRTHNVPSGRMLLGRLKTKTGLIYTPTHSANGGPTLLLLHVEIQRGKRN